MLMHVGEPLLWGKENVQFCFGCMIQACKLKQGVVSHCVALPFYIKTYLLKAKEEELWKLEYFSMQKYNLQKIF